MVVPAPRTSRAKAAANKAAQNTPNPAIVNRAYVDVPPRSRARSTTKKPLAAATKSAPQTPSRSRTSKKQAVADGGEEDSADE